MIAVTPSQMAGIDNFTITEIGIPGMVLMENAALSVVKEIEKDIDCIKGKKYAYWLVRAIMGRCLQLQGIL